MSNAHGGAGAGTVSAFDDGPQGVLSSIGGSPFPNGQTAPCWVEISRDGRHLFAVNTAVPSVSSYRIRRDGTLRLIENTPFDEANAAALGPEDARLSPDDSTLWVVDTKGDSLSGFAVRGGQLTEIDAAADGASGRGRAVRRRRQLGGGADGAGRVARGCARPDRRHRRRGSLDVLPTRRSGAMH